MTLKDKFKKLEFDKEIFDNCEKIAGDYAIEFSEWCCNRYTKLYSVWCPIFGDQRDKNNWRTTKELLEIFKKEKGL